MRQAAKSLLFLLAPPSAVLSQEARSETPLGFISEVPTVEAITFSSRLFHSDRAVLNSNGMVIPNTLTLPRLVPRGHRADYQGPAISVLRGIFNCTSTTKTFPVTQ